MNEYLPKGWISLTLGDFCAFRYGKSLLTKKLTNEGFDVYGANGIIGKYSNYMFESPKLIISCRGALSGILHITNPKSFVTSNSIVIEPILSTISNKFLKYAISALDKTEIITGSAQPQITIQNLKQLVISLPPVEEQKVIVTKIESGYSILNLLKSSVSLLPELNKQVRQRVINSAVKGHLSGYFRKDLSYNAQPESSEITEESFKSSLLFNPWDRISSVPFDIPNNWSWLKLRDIASITSGITKGRKLDSKKAISTPYLRVANVQDGFLDLSEIKYIDILPSELEKYKLLDGDILLTEGGDRDKLGRGTVWRGEIDRCIHQNHIFKARVETKYVDPDFISIYTKSDSAKEYFFENATQTVNLASISLKVLSQIPIPLPSISEQRLISKTVNFYLNRLAVIYKRIDRIQELILSLEKAISTQALSGKLSSQADNKDDLKKIIDSARNLVLNGNVIDKKSFHSKSKSKEKAATKKISNDTMKNKPKNTPEALIQTLRGMGGQASAESLLVACSLEENVDLFFELLRTLRDNSGLEIPVGITDNIKISNNENS